MALDKRYYRQVVEITVDLGQRVGVGEICERIMELVKSPDPTPHTGPCIAELVVIKGDLNYRKLTGNLKWPSFQSFETAIGLMAYLTGKMGPIPISIRTLAPRTCKADVVVGLPKGQGVYSELPTSSLDGRCASVLKIDNQGCQSSAGQSISSNYIVKEHRQPGRGTRLPLIRHPPTSARPITSVTAVLCAGAAFVAIPIHKIVILLRERWSNCASFPSIKIKFLPDGFTKEIVTNRIKQH